MWEYLMYEEFKVDVTLVSKVIEFVRNRIKQYQQDKLFWEYNWAGDFLKAIEVDLIAIVSGDRLSLVLEDIEPPKLKIVVQLKPGISVILELQKCNGKLLQFKRTLRRASDIIEYFSVEEYLSLVEAC